MKIKNVIFDLGAVMFDWNPKAISERFTSNVDLQNRIQSQLYYHQDWKDFDCALITEIEATKRASKRLDISLIQTQELFKQTKESLTLISKTRDVLCEVKDKNLKAYCLSNISPELFNYVHERHDLFEMFDGVVTSGEEKTGKPNKRIFEILIERHQLKVEECLFIDDSKENTATANILGISSVTFKGLDSCYKDIYTYLSSNNTHPLS